MIDRSAMTRIEFPTLRANQDGTRPTGCDWTMLRKFGRVFFLLLLSLLAVADDLYCHDISASFIEINRTEEGIRILYRLPLTELDLLFLVDSNLNEEWEQQEIAGALPQVEKYLEDHLKIHIDGQPLSIHIESWEKQVDSDGHAFLVLEQQEKVPEENPAVALESRLFQDLISAHQTLVSIRMGDRTGQFALSKASPARSWEQSAKPSLSGFLPFLELGVEHIFTGYDHILFLVGLLLTSGAFRELVKVVSSFTVAHSLTLGLAALDVVRPNPQLIEVAIACSILYIGLENLLRDQALGSRWKLTFFFGLVHGFGFANILREMVLPRADLVVSLFSFNLGVEVGQILIVALLWPIILAVQQFSWRLQLVRTASVIICGFGTYWLIERLW